MGEIRFRFDDYLDKLNATDARAMARLWGGRNNLSKLDAIKIIRDGLNDPVKTKAVVDALATWKRGALAVLRYMGGSVQYSAIGLGLMAAGVEIPIEADNEYFDSKTIASQLFKHGLLMSSYQHNPGYFSEYSSDIVWSDLRLMRAAGDIPVESFSLPTLAVPEHTSYRRPAVVALDLLSVMKAVEQRGGLQLTKNGLIRAIDIQSLRKSLRWPEEDFEIDGFSFPDPTTAWVYALANSGLMGPTEDKLILIEPLMNFADRPIYEQVHIMLYGLVNSGNWLEITPPSRWFDEQGFYRAIGRLLLNIGLTALPPDGRHFYSPDDFDEALFERVGAHFSLNGNAIRPYHFRYNQDFKQEAKWKAQRRAAWLQLERNWIESALTSWLYFLGIVELASDGEYLVGFRLTELGRSVFHPNRFSGAVVQRSVVPEELSPITGEPPWIVQPNFDIVVYLERATSLQLAFLERHAERQQTHNHTANYLLTRESVYRGLESGSDLEEFLRGLQVGSVSELPQNVVTEIREWAALRERITVHRYASLLEFKDNQVREKNIRKGLIGKLIGERFFLLAAPHQQTRKSQGSRRIDYNQPLPKCLTISEDGRIAIKSNCHDLLIRAQLRQWTQCSTNGFWQLTPESIRLALDSKFKIEQLLNLLQERLSHKIPKLLQLALHSWADSTSHKVELAQITVLRCTNSSVFDALTTSQKLQPFFKGIISPDILLVDTAQLDAFRSQLEWLQLEISTNLTVQSLRQSK